MSDGDATGGATTYAFGDLDRRGKFFGLHLPHFVLGWLVLFSLIPILHAGSAATVVWLLIADSAVVNVAFGRLLDRGLWEWAPVLAGRACQMWMGAACDAAGRARTARTRPTRSSRPGRTVAVDFAGGRPRLGGRRRAQAEGEVLRGILAGPRRLFSLLDSGTQQARVDGRGRLLTGLTTYHGRLIRMTVLERTIPDSGDAVQRHFDHTLGLAAPPGPDRRQDARRRQVVGANQQLITEAGPSAQRHESLITVVMGSLVHVPSSLRWSGRS